MDPAVDGGAPGAPTREELVRHLVRTRIAGEVDTPRQNNLKHYRQLAAGDAYFKLGLSFERDWEFGDILDVMAKMCGVSPDPRHQWGTDTIDPERTVDALEAAAGLIAGVARDGGNVLVATGHPDALMETYRSLLDAMTGAGAIGLTPAAGFSYGVRRVGDELPTRTLEWHGGVGAVGDGVRLRHSHDPFAMRAMLKELEESDGGGFWPDLVIADHGFAGAAAQAGIPTIGFADCNDPGLFVGAAEGTVAVAVPLDDNVLPSHYRPMTAYILAAAGLA
ncbi:phosphatase [Allonocardiopsis opalescens]|uniref:Histidinol phosphate phosphatase hisN-like protein n=1 Tax=Allonocardiopsis opalescens TaxID=1144618 RepID=A0A2T0Q7V6_9ACTN|nr:phosphatase [Allonocardiopsis opalescens]PRX99871.1 histidinol phosphate phosphatase hisN-like protein [Allonocardiopsis opalescens]